MKTAEIAQKSTVTDSDLRSLPTSTTTASRPGGLCFAAQTGHNLQTCSLHPQPQAPRCSSRTVPRPSCRADSQSKPPAAQGALGTGELRQPHVGFLPLSPHRMQITALAKPQDLPLSNLTYLCTVFFN